MNRPLRSPGLTIGTFDPADPGRGHAALLAEIELGEDLATVDVLSGGRGGAGVSIGPPMHWDRVKDALHPGTEGIEAPTTPSRTPPAWPTTCRSSPTSPPAWPQR